METAGNQLFPIFLKLEQLSVLVVGGGIVGHEKLQALLSNSPKANVRLVSLAISDPIHEMAQRYSNVTLLEKAYEPTDLDGVQLLIVAVNNKELSAQIKKDATKRNILANVADTPDQCDFYLGSIVQKGHLKIAISTNGKSPTIAKRLKETFNDTLPDEMENVLDNMQRIRDNISGDFSEKVKQLNEITKVLAGKGN